MRWAPSRTEPESELTSGSKSQFTAETGCGNVLNDTMGCSQPDPKSEKFYRTNNQIYLQIYCKEERGRNSK